MSYDTPGCEVSDSGPGCQSGYRRGDLWRYDTPMWEVSGSGPGCQSGYRSDDLWSYDTPGCEVSDSGPGCQSGYRNGDLWSFDTPVWAGQWQVLVVRVDIGGVTYEAMTPQCGRSVVQVSWL